MEDVAASGKVIDVETRGTSTYAMQNRLTHYLNSHGVSNSDVREMDELSDKSIKKQLNKGNTVVIYADNFKLYNEKGKAVFSDRIGAHGMTVTDVNDDGTYTVSSWGEKYYYKPDGDEYGDEPFTYVVINVDTTDD
ncbi:MAG: hypothetical protein K6E54_08730 [Bacteroidaceae bacterium]|nr:hypothetical protein [Bacteroidaceae bacterium]